MLGIEVAGVITSLLVLAAHFLRAGAPLLALGALGLIGILIVRRPWVARVVQVALLLGALEWVRTTVRLAGERLRAGEPASRMVIILALVAAIACWSAVALSRGRLGRVYGLRPAKSGEPDPYSPGTGKP